MKLKTHNQNMVPNVGNISVELRTQPIHVRVVVRGGATRGDNETTLNAQPTTRNKVQFDVET